MNHPDEEATLAALATILEDIDAMIDDEGLCRKCILMSVAMSCVTTLYGCRQIDADDIKDMTDSLNDMAKNGAISKIRNRMMN